MVSKDLDNIGTDHTAGMCRLIYAFVVCVYSKQDSKESICLCDVLYMSRVMGKPVFGFLTRSDTNRAFQPQKIARGLKFQI